MIDETATPDEPMVEGREVHNHVAGEHSAGEHDVGEHDAGEHDAGEHGAGEQLAHAESAAVTEPATGVDPVVVAEPAVVAEPVVQTVYVHAPVPPRMRGNRGFGLLVAILAAVVFAVIYAVVVVIVMPMFAPAGAAGFDFTEFINASAFLVPIAVFFVAFVLLVLLANRATWWAYIIGSLIVGVIVYFATIGIVLLLNNVVSMTTADAEKQFQALASKPWVIIAAIVAREMAIWFGALVASRGRRQRVKNAEARSEFEAESARKKAEFERTTAASTTA
jgi:hypothetical protein